MVANAGSLNVRVGADISDLVSGMRRAQDSVKGSVNVIEKSAKASARVFEDARRKADALLGAVDPLYAAQVRYDKELGRATQLMKAGALTANEMAKVQAGLKMQLDQTARSFSTVGGVSNRSRNAMQQLGFQVGDVSQGLAMGTKVSTIFMQQSGQVIQALQLMGGEGNKFLRFLGGPWGIALAAAAVLLTPLIAKLFDTKDALTKVIDKMREQAQQAALNEQADKIWKKTIEGLTAAIKARRKEQEAAIQSDKGAEQESLKNAREELVNVENLQKKKAAELSRAVDRFRGLQGQLATSAQDPRAAGPIRQELDGAREAIQRLRKELANLNHQIEEGQKAVRGAQGALLTREAEGAIDPIKRQTDSLELQIQHLNEKFEAGKIGPAKYRVEIEKLKKSIKDLKEETKDTKALSNFISPVDGGSITGRFGEKRPGHMHTGVDRAVPVGTAVKAPASGVVIEAGTVPGYGNVIFIDHGGGVVSRLAHLSKIGVVKGQLLTQGQQIGLSGGAKGAPGSGNSQGPHLHQEVRVGGRAVDPLKGRFATDDAAAALSAQDKAEKAEKDRIAAVERATKQQNDFEEAKDRLNTQLLQAEGVLIKGVEAQAQFAINRANDDEQRTANAIQNDLEEGKYGEATSELAKSRASQLQLINQMLHDEQRNSITVAKLQALDEIAYKLRNDEMGIVVDGLRYKDEIVKSQAAHRAAQLAILDAVYKQKQYELEHEKQLAIRNGATQAEIDAIQGKINALPGQQAQDTERVNRGTQGPLEEWAASVPQAADEINEALQNIEVEGLNGLSDAIFSVIEGTKSMSEAFSELAKSIIADLIKMIIKMLIFRAVSAFLPGGGGAAGAGINISSSAASQVPLIKYASGGAFTVLGKKGVDNNVLSLNGLPIAQVSHGERIGVDATGGSANGAVTIQQTIQFEGVAITQTEFMRGLALTKTATVDAIREMNRRRR